jgi:collagen type II alpha
MNDALDQYISRSYKLFKNFTEIWKVVTNKYIKHEGLGSKDQPADTCEDLFKMKPTLPSGDYWIDPNSGNTKDAVLVHCNATNYETCIWPKAPMVESVDIEESGEYVWALKDINDEPVMEYAASHVQIKMLRLKSEFVRQNITYKCFGNSRKLKVLTDDEMTLDMDETATSINDGCTNVPSNTWGQTVFEIETEELETLPLQDIALQVSKTTRHEKFSLEFGPICFS